MSEQKSCPDGGRCWHGCVNRCFRVNNCGPLSGVFDGNEWPDDIKIQHTEPQKKIDVIAGMRMGADQLRDFVARHRHLLEEDDFEMLNALHRLLIKGSAQIEGEQQ